MHLLFLRLLFPLDCAALLQGQERSQEVTLYSMLFLESQTLGPVH
jgi:hypothetical protein